MQEGQQEEGDGQQPGETEIRGRVAPGERDERDEREGGREGWLVSPYSSSPQQQTVVVPSPEMYWLLQESAWPEQLAGITAIPTGSTEPPLHPCSQ